MHTQRHIHLWYITLHSVTAIINSCYYVNVYLCNASIASCSDGAFLCNNGRCILSSDHCDGVQHCTDGSDEACKLYYVLWDATMQYSSTFLVHTRSLPTTNEQGSPYQCLILVLLGWGSRVRLVQALSTHVLCCCAVQKWSACLN